MLVSVSHAGCLCDCLADHSKRGGPAQTIGTRQGPVQVEAAQQKIGKTILFRTKERSSKCSCNTVRSRPGERAQLSAGKRTACWPAPCCQRTLRLLPQALDQCILVCNGSLRLFARKWLKATSKSAAAPNALPSSQWYAPRTTRAGSLVNNVYSYLIASLGVESLPCCRAGPAFSRAHSAAQNRHHSSMPVRCRVPSCQPV